MPANLSKRSVVKHRTNKGYHSGQKKGETSTGANNTSLGERKSGKERSGFQVGPKHAPDGAYLGRAKKIKADLIEKAKIKKRYFKSVKGVDGKDQAGEGEVILPEDLLNRDEGKFAPERAEEEDLEDEVNGKNILYQMRNRGDASSSASLSSKNSRGREKRSGVEANENQTKRWVKTTPSNEKSGKGTAAAATKDDGLTKEEKEKLRLKRQERWNSQSGSQRGRERGQPNLGARMDLLLEKIKQG